MNARARTVRVEDDTDTAASVTVRVYSGSDSQFVGSVDTSESRVEAGVDAMVGLATVSVAGFLAFGGFTKNVSIVRFDIGTHFCGMHDRADACGVRNTKFE